MILDPLPAVSSGGEQQGGTLIFRSPELLLPTSETENQISTPEADIYAFGLVIHQVCEEHRESLLSIYTIQVLTGKNPFHGVRAMEVVSFVITKHRPDKPANASAIGFSDSLWTFTQLCWADDMHSRPVVTEVVTRLGEEAANWRELMPPSGQDEQVGSVLEGPMLDFAENSSFKFLVSPMVSLIER
jgi:serine/threonine protein kinase